MSSITATRRRLQSAETLQAVVTTMKTLSAVRITHYRRSVAALQESTRTLELAVQALQLRLGKGVDTLIVIDAAFIGKDQPALFSDQCFVEHALSEDDPAEV